MIVLAPRSRTIIARSSGGRVGPAGTGGTFGDLGGDADDNASLVTYVAAQIAASVTGLLDLKGSTDCSANPNYPAASKGDFYRVSVAGKIGGASGKSVEVGDAVVALADNAGGSEASVGTSWFVLEHNLASALQAANNLSDLASASSARSNLGLAIGTDVMGVGGGTFTGDISVPAEAYDEAAWNGSNEAPTKDAIRDKVEAITAVGGSTAVQVDIYTTPGAATWNKPTGAKFVVVDVIGGGGGGGSGILNSAGTNRSGGSGGTGSARSEGRLAAAALSASVTVTVGAGGAGGASNASAGSNGGDSSFGSYCFAGGGRGGASSAAGSAGISPANTVFGTFAPQSSGAGVTSGTAGSGQPSTGAAGSGGGAGGINGSNTTGTPGSGGKAPSYVTGVQSGSSGAGGGGAAGTLGSKNGSAAADRTAGDTRPGEGGGGGYPSNDGSTAAGNGGNGQFPGGGGGGGASSLTGGAFGSGGTGGGGQVVVTTYF
jgi:hypothetical protein